MTIVEIIQAYAPVFAGGFSIAFAWHFFVSLVIGRQIAITQEFTRMK